MGEGVSKDMSYSFTLIYRDFYLWLFERKCLYIDLYVILVLLELNKLR